MTSYRSPRSSVNSSVVKQPTVSIIVVTVNTPKMTRACLESVIRHTTVPYQLIVVNNSPAGAIRKCLKTFHNIEIIQNPKNFGYTKAANQGALHSSGEFLCFLNTDTLVPPRWAERLLEAVRLPQVGAVTPLVDWKQCGSAGPFRKAKTPEAIEASTLLINQAFQKWYRGHVKSARWLCGFCLMIPRTVMTCVGLFDERFFFGWEDIDYSLQLRLKGYRLLKARSLFVYHQGGASSSVKKRKQLVKKTERRFLSKWNSLLNTKHRDSLAVFASVDRRVAKSRLLQCNRQTKKSGAISRPRLIRTGFAIQSQAGKKIKALVRLSDLETFSPSPMGRRLWKFLDGSRSLGEIAHGIFSKKNASQHADMFVKNQLAAWVHPPALGPVIVTVMMATHNSERWIAEAIESVLAQTFRRFELIIIDDGSTDQTASITRQYEWHSQVRFLQNQKQLGIAATRNRILRLARGRYIAVCDADDIMRPTLLQRFTDFLDAHPNVGWVYADRLDILEILDITGRQGPFLGPDPALSMNGSREYKRNVMHHAGALIRRKIMLELGGYDETLASIEDYDMALKLAERAQIAALSGEVHYLYRHHAGSTSRTSPWAKPDTRRLIVNAIRRQKKTPTSFP